MTALVPGNLDDLSRVGALGAGLEPPLREPGAVAVRTAASSFSTIRIGCSPWALFGIVVGEAVGELTETLGRAALAAAPLAGGVAAAFAAGG